MSRAKHAQIVDCLATPTLSRRTALPVASHKRATQAISGMDLSLRGARDVRANLRMRSPDFHASPPLFGIRSSAAPRGLCLGKAFFFDSLDEQVHRALDHDRQIAAWIRMAEQVDRVLEFLFQLHGSVELNPITRRRKRFEH